MKHGMLLLLPVGAAFLSMLVYAVAGRRRDADAERKGARFLLGVGDFLLHWFMWVVSPAERLALSLGMGPDVFNLAGLLFGAASGVLIALGQLELGGLAIALGGVADILDGRVARALGVDSKYGKFIDSTLDRFVEAFAFLGFAVYLRGFELGPLVVVGAISGSLLVSYARARGESLGVLCRGGLMQRAERLVITCLACLADPALADWLGLRPGTIVMGALSAIAVLTFATAAHRTVWIARRLREEDRKRG